MHHTLQVAALAVLTVLFAACAPSTQNASFAERGEAHVLTFEQIQRASAANAYDVVRALRPAWLQTRGRQSINYEGELLVYLEHVRLGGVQSLRQVPTETVFRMEYLDAGSATQRWGVGHTHGAILITARTQ